jgi:UDP-4-amino-4,6-dideoxy-N-acetyl-beta-L-altrosamine transaminase
MIPYGKQTIDEDDIEAVANVLRSDYLTQGETLTLFEDIISSKLGAMNAVAVNSATSALHIACLSLGLSNGGRLWTSPISYVASANCGLYCGASVDFVDIDADTQNISVTALEQKLVMAKRDGSLPNVLVVVHMAGQSCDMTSIFELSKKYNFKIIEDASHALGGKFHGEYIGCCKYSDITVFSLHPIKSITSGEGGLALTNSDFLAQKLRLFRNHGIDKDFRQRDEMVSGAWYYEQVELGFNYRMSDIHAALGLSQLRNLDDFITRRNQIARVYDGALSGLPLKLPIVSADCYSSFHLYIVQLDKLRAGISRQELFNTLRSMGIGVNVHYIPIHTQPYFQNLGFRRGNFPQAEDYYANALSLPIFPTLTSSQQDYIISSLVELTASSSGKAVKNRR